MSLFESIKSMWSSNKRSQPVVCCYCLEEILVETNSNKCSHCYSELPVQYRENYADAPPFFIQVAGWSRVGKTVFLQALTMIIQHLGYVWPRFTYQPISDVSLRYVREIERSLKEGVMPESTREDDLDVYVMLLKNMERWGGRLVVIRDCPGEIFDTLHIPEKQAPFLTRTPTTFLMISLSDLDNKNLNSEGRVMDQLFFSYINTLKKHGVHFKNDKRRVVIVFSKADSIDLPNNLFQYLSDDPIWTAINSRSRSEMNAEKMWDYVETMRNNSDQIKEWIRARQVSGDNLIRIAEGEGIELVFSLISSTGAQVPEDGRLPHPLEPRRVLDPFFWALEFQSSDH